LLSQSVISDVQELLASGKSQRRIASILGVGRDSVRKIDLGIHPSQLPRKPRPAVSTRCPICGADETYNGVDLHGEELSCYLAVRDQVEFQIENGIREEEN